MGEMFSEPHSTKPIEDAIGWGMETTPETIVDNELGPFLSESAMELARQVHCPSLVVHGNGDRLISVTAGERLAGALGCEFVLFDGSGHAPNVRDPVRFNLLLRDFVDRVHPKPAPPARKWTRARSRSPRALYLSSPIGLGHALRDIAIAGELRTLRPDLTIDWLTQHPVTAVLGRSRRVDPSGVGRGWSANRRTWRVNPAATICIVSRRSGGWTKSWSRTSTCCRTWSMRAITTW